MSVMMMMMMMIDQLQGTSTSLAAFIAATSLVPIESIATRYFLPNEAILIFST
jgi:hypothetical protein